MPKVGQNVLLDRQQPKDVRPLLKVVRPKRARQRGLVRLKQRAPVNLSAKQLVALHGLPLPIQKPNLLTVPFRNKPIPRPTKNPKVCRRRSRQKCDIRFRNTPKFHRLCIGNRPNACIRSIRTYRPHIGRCSRCRYRRAPRSDPSSSNLCPIWFKPVGSSSCFSYGGPYRTFQRSRSGSASRYTSRSGRRRFTAARRSRNTPSISHH